MQSLFYMPNSDTLFRTAQGTFTLHRLPDRPRELLRAWDAADELIVDYLAERAFKSPRCLIINDTFGALAIALHNWQPQALSDSYLSQHATRLNLLRNQLPETAVQLTHSLENLTGEFDCVLIKVPKTLALLEHQLISLRPHCRPDTQIIVAGMIKNLAPTLWKLLERLLGKTRTSLAKKKARLIFVDFDGTLSTPKNPYPSEYQLENSEYWLSNHANVFSRDHLDIGTRFFLQHLPISTAPMDIIDLACGNGVVGVIAAEKNPDARLHFVDESFMAVASAQTNFQRAHGLTRTATFQVGDGLQEFSENFADVILCNPPFHQQQTLGDQISCQFFQHSKKVLKQHGQLWVIGNRHLTYQHNIQRLFGNCRVIASNNKFVIWRAVNKKR